MNTLRQLQPKNDTSFIATVTKAQNGEALIVTQDGTTEETVTGHGSQVPVIQKGDRVVVLRNTEGCFVTDRVRNKGERPYMANHNGQLIFENQQFIGFKVKGCYISMDETGELILHAENIRAVADALNEIQGNLVKLN